MRESIVTKLWGQVEKTPAKIALYDGTRRCSYQELSEAARRIAGRLAQEGIGLGDRVGVCMPRTNDAIAAIVGILLAGAAYVPLDPSYPAERLELMASRADMKVILGPTELTERLTVNAVGLDPSGSASGWELPVLGRPCPDLKSAAYVLFTSGSTGVPKGVQVSHGNVIALLDWAHRAFATTDFDACALDASFSFDPSVLQIFGPLTIGGMVRILANPLSMINLSPEDPITFAMTTPSTLGELVRAGRIPSSLRTLIVGGEVFPPALAERVLKQTSVRRLVAAYGPTEATVLTSTYDLSAPVDDPVPIGRDLPGTYHLILDGDLDPVAEGEVGEIFIAGDQVADGYLHAPELTAERFIDWQRGDQAVERIYRSGDLGRRRPDGVLEFVGRADQQIKLRGYRIEPGEIEAVMRRYPGVAGAFVGAVGDGPSAKLIGYIVPEDKPVPIDDLLVSLRSALTPYMVPAGIMALAKLPLTPTGKLDQSALPAWQPTSDETTKTPIIRDSVEDVVSSLIAEVLDIDRPLRPNDDFIDDLGGTSLGIVRLLVLMEQAFERHLPIDRVVSDTTVSGFADLVGDRGSADPAMVVAHGGGSKLPLFLFHAYLGAVLRYRPLGRYLSPERPLIAINANGLDEECQGATTIEAMASQMLAQVRQIQPDGPYLLGGHSAGGLIAYEMAHQLLEMGEEVAQLIILDSPVSSPRWRYYWSEAALNWPEIRHATAAERMDRLQRMVRSRLSLHRRAAVEDRVAAAIERTNRLSNLACLHYATPHYPGDLVILRSKQGIRMAAGDRQLGWERYVGGSITCLDIEGGHTTMFDPQFVASVGGRLNELLGDALVAS